VNDLICASIYTFHVEIIGLLEKSLKLV